MKYIPLDNKTALHKLRSGRLPFNWDLNIYRGCEHGCLYCYAIYSHHHLEDEYFFDSIYYKKNVLIALEKELSKPSWNHETINMGGVCDSYQPIESKLEITREVLKLMIKYKNPIIISTKSTLILRDLDLIKELAEVTSVNIACTITCLEDTVQKIIEPNASKSMDRFKVLKKIKEETKANIGVHLMPIIPLVTDSHENLDAIYHIASDIGVDYVLPGTMYLRGKTKPHFLNNIKEYDFHLYQQLYELYRKGSLSKDYKTQLYHRINTYQKKYKL